MRRSPCLYRPTSQQQAQNDDEKQLLLFRQAFHEDNVAVKQADGNNLIICDLRFTIYAANFNLQVIRNSQIANRN
jgi:hypothetical protein